MKRQVMYGLLAATLSLGVAGSAFSAALNTTPSRESKLLFGFEDGTENWISDPAQTGDNTNATINTDAQFVAEGKQSLKLDLTGVGDTGWTEPAFEVKPTDAIDLSGYNVLTADIFVPEGSLNEAGGWFQPNPRITDAATTAYYGNRDLVNGWNHVSWVLQTGTGKDTSRIFFALGNDSARPWSGPIYLDNVRAWKEALPGVHADETLITGFDKAADMDDVAVKDDTFAASINTDKKFVSAGDGSLEATFDTNGGWHNDEFTYTLPTPVDVSKALAVRLDVFVPGTSHPSSWWQVGLEINGDAGGNVGVGPYGIFADQWETIEIPLTPEQATSLGNLTNIKLRRNSGETDPYVGPIYVDSLRIANPASVVTVVKGDINGDGKVNIGDATLALQISVGNLTATADQLTAGDVITPGDGIKIGDVVKILQVAVGNGSF